jgi:hypothetical protein
VLPVFGKVDGGHPAGTEFTLDGIAVDEGGSEAADGIGHRAAAPRWERLTTLGRVQDKRQAMAGMTRRARSCEVRRVYHGVIGSKGVPQISYSSLRFP